MGNASGRNDGEGTSGAPDEEGFMEEGVEFGPQQGHEGVASVDTEPMLHSPSHTPMGLLQIPLSFTPQVPVNPLPGSSAIHNVQHALAHRSTDFNVATGESPKAVMITWSYGGRQVSVTGSWDNWSRRESLQRWGSDFNIMKMLPSGVYHYRFIVDESFRYAPDLPWEYDNSGIPYNVLDVQEYIPDAPESLSEFESPPSPDSSYNNEFYDEDPSKPPPEIPPQLQSTLLSNRYSSIDGHPSLPRPQHSVLNHMYIQNIRGQPVALGTTHRFLQKYVTVVLYKPSRR